jgi:predicted negative regulator of RcsB-dependent stress response
MFYFCFREGRIGYDGDAAAVYNKALKDDPDFKTGIPPAVIFSPGGHQALKHLPKSKHFEKDAFYEFLRDALRENPFYDAAGPEEKKLLAAAAAAPKDPAAQYSAGRAREAAAGADAPALYEKAIAAGPGSEWAARAHLRLATLARCARDWEEAEKHLEAAQREDLADDVAMERAHRLLAGRKDAEALKLLDATIQAHATSNRLGELRFYAGVANWRLDRKNWANYHWWWVLENLPDDHLVNRCSVALTAPVNCFANPELDGFAGAAEMTINEGIAQRKHARNDYEELKEKYGK